MWVSDANGTIEAGDLITSSAILGYGQKQSDDLLRSYTVAKSTMDCDFSVPMIPEKRIRKDVYGKNVLDTNGWPIWDDVMVKNRPIRAIPTPIIDVVEDDGGVETVHMIPSYEIRYLRKVDATIITKEEYDASNELEVCRAVFMGVTYHCG